MKPGIHPEYIPSKITCACGRVTETYATVEEIHVEICSHCHPFYTGRQKLVDTAGRVERFRRKYATDGTTADEAEAEEAVAAEAESGATGEESVPAPVGAGEADAGQDGDSDETED